MSHSNTVMEHRLLPMLASPLFPALRSRMVRLRYADRAEHFFVDDWLGVIDVYVTGQWISVAECAGAKATVQHWISHAMDVVQTMVRSAERVRYIAGEHVLALYPHDPTAPIRWIRLPIPMVIIHSLQEPHSAPFHVACAD